MSEQAVFDALKYRVVVDCHGNRLYYNNAGWLHRTDGPAIECPDNSKYWYQYGHLHRTDGPAIERFDGCREWWINGVELPVYQVDLNIDFSSFCPNTYNSVA